MSHRSAVTDTQSAYARAAGQAFRDENFDTMARAAVQSMAEIERERRLDDLQEALAYLGMIPGAGIVFDLTNVAISLARGNYQDAAIHAVFLLPVVGTVAGVAVMGYALGQSLIGDANRLSSQADETTMKLSVSHRVSWVSGRGGSNSFAAGTGVVTGTDEDGNPITTNIEDLQVGDVVLSGNELDPSDPTHYALVTDVHAKTVYEQTQLTYVDEDGNIEVLKTTSNHEFYVTGPGTSTGWTTAAELQAGAMLTLSNGQTATVLGTETIEVPEGLTVYNLTVSDGSTYFVDDGTGSVSAVWVHNRGRKVISLLKGSSGKLLKKNNRVYVGVLNGRVVYVGITKQNIFVRQAQHLAAGKGFKIREITPATLTRRQARAIEQVIINKLGRTKTGGVLQNKINSIGINRDWYKKATDWATPRADSLLKGYKW